MKYSLRTKLSLLNKDTINLISQQFYTADPSWNTVWIESIGISAMSQGLIVKVKDSSDRIIWDANVHNNGLCTTILEHMAQNMANHNPNFKGGYVEKSYPVLNNFKQAGTVDIGYYGLLFSSDLFIRFGKLNEHIVNSGLEDMSQHKKY